MYIYKYHDYSNYCNENDDVIMIMIIMIIIINVKHNSSTLKVLASLQKLHSGTNATRDKNKYLSLVAPHFSGQFLRSVGFQFSSSSFANALKKKIEETRHFMPPSKQPISEQKKKKNK